MKCEEEIQTLEPQLKDLVLEYDAFQLELAEKDEKMKQLETDMRKQLTKYTTIATSHEQLKQRAEKVQALLTVIKEPLEIQKSIVEKCDMLLKKIVAVMIVNRTTMRDLLSIDFDYKIYANLETQRIRGKFLSLINRNDLRGLGFEIFEHQCVLQNSIELLVEKYPIPKVSATLSN